MTRSSSRNPTALAAALSLALLAACGGGDTEVLECTGTCSCDEDTRECSCEGGSDCTVDGADGVTFTCDGNARCDLSCGEDCVIECPGTSGCTAIMDDGSSGVCNGSGSCDYTCTGDCTVDCPGASTCSVTCDQEGATCELTSCPESSLQDCGDGVTVCRGSCPS